MGMDRHVQGAGAMQDWRSGSMAATESCFLHVRKQNALSQ